MTANVGASLVGYETACGGCAIGVVWRKAAAFASEYYVVDKPIAGECFGPPSIVNLLQFVSSADRVVTVAVQ